MRGISEEALRGMISMLMDFNIPIIRADNATEAAKFIIAIAKREAKGDLRSISLKDGGEGGRQSRGRSML